MMRGPPFSMWRSVCPTSLQRCNTRALRQHDMARRIADAPRGQSCLPLPFPIPNGITGLRVVPIPHVTLKRTRTLALVAALRTPVTRPLEPYCTLLQSQGGPKEITCEFQLSATKGTLKVVPEPSEPVASRATICFYVTHHIVKRHCDLFPQQPCRHAVARWHQKQENGPTSQ